MISLIVFLLTITTVLSYDVHYDNINVEAILNNKETIRAYLDCFTDKGACGERLDEMKEIMSEVFETACAKCTPKQTQHCKTFFAFVEEKYPDDLTVIKKKYDPESKYYAGLKAACQKA